MDDHTPTTPDTAEPWESNYALNSAIHKLLLHIQDFGPRTEEQIKRHCITPREIAGLMPESEKQNYSHLMAEELIDLLEGNPEPGVAISTQAWQQSARRVRAQLRWDMLPPITVKRAACRADFILLHALIEEWLELQPSPSREPRWSITHKGLHAIDHFNTNDQRINIQD